MKRRLKVQKVEDFWIYVFAGTDAKWCYVGVTTNPKARFRQHCNRMKNGTHHNRWFQRDVLMGCPFTFVVVEELRGITRREAEIHESRWATKLRRQGWKTYNLEWEWERMLEERIFENFMCESEKAGHIQLDRYGYPLSSREAAWMRREYGSAWLSDETEPVDNLQLAHASCNASKKDRLT